MLMTSLLDSIKDLVSRRSLRISDHGYNELSNDGISAREVVDGIQSAAVVREYPEYARGPCVLVLQRDGQGGPIHVVWGIPKNAKEPAVLVTAYRPDPEVWHDDFLRRKQ
jgi:hypothetical protein